MKWLLRFHKCDQKEDSRRIEESKNEISTLEILREPAMSNILPPETLATRLEKFGSAVERSAILFETKVTKRAALKPISEVAWLGLMMLGGLVLGLLYAMWTLR